MTFSQMLKNMIMDCRLSSSTNLVLWVLTEISHSVQMGMYVKFLKNQILNM